VAIKNVGSRPEGPSIGEPQAKNIMDALALERNFDLYRKLEIHI
jgi:hypothetical protein